MKLFSAVLTPNALEAALHKRGCEGLTWVPKGNPRPPCSALGS